MPVHCEFTQIVGDDPVVIGDSKPVWEANFDTEGRKSSGSAFLVFNVRGLALADADVKVKVNNQLVGKIFRHGSFGACAQSGNAEYWHTQMITLSGSMLKDGANEIQIEAIGVVGEKKAASRDDFELKDLMCFFHQAA